MDANVAEAVAIRFPDRETERRALGFLVARFSGRVTRSGAHYVPLEALAALAEQGIPFTLAADTPKT